MWTVKTKADIVDEKRIVGTNRFDRAWAEGKSLTESNRRTRPSTFQFRLIQYLFLVYLVFYKELSMISKNWQKRWCDKLPVYCYKEWTHLNRNFMLSPYCKRGSDTSPVSTNLLNIERAHKPMTYNGSEDHLARARVFTAGLLLRPTHRIIWIARWRKFYGLWYWILLVVTFVTLFFIFEISLFQGVSHTYKCKHPCSIRKRVWAIFLGMYKLLRYLRL